MGCVSNRIICRKFIMAKTTKSKKAKGTRYEKEISARIEDVLGHYGVKAARTPMSGAIDRFKSDIFTNLPVAIECKNQEKLNFRKAWRQAKGDASVNDIPMVITSRNSDPESIVIMDFEDLLFLMELALQAGWVDGLKSKKPYLKS